MLEDGKCGGRRSHTVVFLAGLVPPPHGNEQAQQLVAQVLVTPRWSFGRTRFMVPHLNIPCLISFRIWLELRVWKTCLRYKSPLDKGCHPAVGQINDF